MEISVLALAALACVATVVIVPALGIIVWLIRRRLGASSRRAFSDRTWPKGHDGPRDSPLHAAIKPLPAAGQAATVPYIPGIASAATADDIAAHFPQLEIVELLGKGGMGAVYKARQPHLDRFIALKILPADASRDPTFVERFGREAKAMARLSHPNIVAVYDYGRSGDLCWLMMEYIDGVNVRQAIRAGLSPQETLQILPQLCDALQFAHDEGVVHRDIKPENILLDRRGRVKVADFGLAKLLGPNASTGLTATQQVMGTLHYMAPEQLAGARAVDHRADIYSLGVTFYEMLTGELPLGRFPPPSKTSGVDARLDAVVLRTLEREPAERYQRASEVKTDVELIGQDVVQSAPEIRSQATQPGPTATLLSYAIWVGFPTVLLLALFIVPMTVALFLVGVNGATVPAAFTGGMVIAFVFGGLNLLWWLIHRRQPGSRRSPEDVNRKVRRAGNWLFAAGIVIMLGWIPVVILVTWLMAHEQGAAVPLFMHSAWSVVAGVVVTLSGRSMAQMRRYGLAMTGSILAMVPFSVGVVLGLPVGIWCLILLCRRDVCDEFERAAWLAKNREYQSTPR